VDIIESGKLNDSFTYSRLKCSYQNIRTNEEIAENVKIFCGNDEFYSKVRNDRYSIT
jgi:hypothetical protein